MTADIALIDSGVNPGHVHVQTISGGHGYVVNSNGAVETTHDFMDTIGHGTAISGIIRQKAPLANLYAIKIFQRDLTAPVLCLTKALKWAIDQEFNIIHLSLGLENETRIHDLKQLCQKACDRNIIILASARGPGDKMYPAFFQTVIGVYWNQGCSSDEIVYHPDSRVEFGAHGWPRPIPGMPQERNLRGNSFAVAHITARVANLVKLYPNKNLSWIKENLAKEAKTIQGPVTHEAMENDG